MAQSISIVETLVSKLIDQAPNHSAQHMIDSVFNQDVPDDADIVRGAAAGFAAGVIGTLAKVATEQFFPVAEKSSDVHKTLNIGETKVNIDLDTGDVITGLVVGSIYGAAAEVAPQVTAGRGLGLGSAIYGLKNATEVIEGKDVHIAKNEEHESHELLSDMVYGLVTELCRGIIRNSIDD